MARAAGRPAPATLRDVARLAEVHPGTVSRALNEETRRLVNDDTARRVIKAAEELGYRPNSIARGLKTNRSYTVGILVPDLTNPLFPPIVRGIQDRLESVGYTPLIANTDNDPARERNDFDAMRARRVDGVIAATARLEPADELADAGLPVVYVLRRHEDGDAPSAAADDRRGCELAVEHLVELGHTRIAHLGGPIGISTGRERHEGFVAAMERAGLAVDPALVRFGAAFTEPVGRALCEELLESGGEATAIVAGNDLMALGCYDALAARGMACPEDMSVVGFNDMPFSERFDPPLTTIGIPQYELGAAAADLLLEQLHDAEATAREVTLASRLVVRRSTGAPPGPVQA
jgi:LacI family transcriptional regulator